LQHEEIVKRRFDELKGKVRREAEDFSEELVRRLEQKLGSRQ